MRTLIRLVVIASAIAAAPSVASAQSRDCSFKISAELPRNAEYAPITITTSTRWRAQAVPTWHKLKEPLVLRRGRTVKSDLIKATGTARGCPSTYIFELSIGCPAYGSIPAKTRTWEQNQRRRDAEMEDGWIAVFDLGDVLHECRRTDPAPPGAG